MALADSTVLKRLLVEDAVLRKRLSDLILVHVALRSWQTSGIVLLTGRQHLLRLDMRPFASYL